MKKIMVVDNEPDIVDLTRTVLELGGYTVVPSYSGEEALRRLEKEKVDLVLLDIMMPGMSGWDVFNRIKKKNKDIKVAFMSVLDISDKRKQVLIDEGLADYIMKPFDKETLLQRVDKILKVTDFIGITTAGMVGDAQKLYDLKPTKQGYDFLITAISANDNLKKL